MGVTATAMPSKRRGKKRVRALSHSCRQGLARADLEILEGLLNQKHEFIDDPKLHENDVESALFPPDFDEKVEASGFAGEAAAVPSEFRKMTPEQEREVFLRYNFARMRVVELLASREASEPISLSLARKLVRWHRRVLAIRTEIVNANFPLVLAMAKHSRFASIDMNEMISEGNMALLRSINKFNLSKGYRFSSYACRAILKAYARVAHRISRYRSQFVTEYDSSLEPDNGPEVRHEERQEQFIEELQFVMNENRAHLNEVERLVICERFAVRSPEEVVPGDPIPEPKTLGEVGDMVGLTKERVRQIQNRALEKLRIAMANRFAAA